MSSILHFIRYRDLVNWGVNSYNLTANMNTKYDTTCLSNVLRQTKNYEILDNKNYYKLSGIHSYGKGLFHRDIKLGKDIKSKHLNKLQNNQFIYSRLGAHTGSFDIVNKKFNNYYVSNEVPTFEFKNNNIYPYFLKLIFLLNRYWEDIRKSLQGTAHKRFKEKYLLNLKIPLPPLEKQKELVNNYQEKIHLAREQEQLAQQKEKDIETYLYKELGIQQEQQENNNNLLQFVRFKDLDNWSVDSLLHSNISFLHSNIFEMRKLSCIVSINPITSFKDLSNNLDVSFVPMKYIDGDKGEIINQDITKVKKCKGYTNFIEGDLLWSKITPCMQNGKSAIASNLINGYGCGSTEYHLLRNDKENINIKYIHHILRTNIVLKTAMKYFTGTAGQQRVPKEFLETLKIPLPPLESQNEIANHIQNLKDEIAHLKEQSTENQNLALSEFEKEIFTNN